MNQDEQIFDLLYEGVTDPDAVEKAIMLCLKRLNASGGNIQVTSKTDYRPLYFAGYGEGYTQAAITDYLDHWQYANAHRDAMRRAYEQQPGKVFLCHEHISEEDFATGAYFQEFFSQIGQRWLIGGLVRDADGIEISIAFSRSQGTSHFTSKEAAFISDLMRHVRRATAIALKLGLPVGAPPTSIGSGLAAARIATFLIDKTGKVHWQNEAAHALIDEAVGLSLKDGALHVADQAAAKQVRQATLNALDRRLAATPQTIIHIDHPKTPLEIDIVPASMPQSSLVGSVSLALVMVRRLGLTEEVGAKLRQLHGLTQAESELAVLMAEGIGIDEAAQRRSVSPHTVRTHLRSIFSKTGVSQQTALTALVWRYVNGAS